MYVCAYSYVMAVDDVGDVYLWSWIYDFQRVECGFTSPTWYVLVEKLCICSFGFLVMYCVSWCRYICLTRWMFYRWVFFSWLYKFCQWEWVCSCLVLMMLIFGMILSVLFVVGIVACVVWWLAWIVCLASLVKLSNSCVCQHARNRDW